MVDLRSDTVTRPTQAMRQAMANAVVGDDVLGDDPTVKELEAKFAATLGKEASVFMPSGSMCNLAAILTHCRAGDEILMEENTHTFRYEAGSACRFAAVQVSTFQRSSGIPEVSDILTRIRNADDEHQPRSSLFVLENTHNVAGGRPVPLERVRELCDAAHEKGLKVHMDGARLFNAAQALGTTVAALSSPVDSVMCCLSKGLGAPVGSLLAGHNAFIKEARRARKALGGGMRQSGVLAAAGLIALAEGPSLLAKDHERAKKLARALDAMPAVSVDVESVSSNMVMAWLDGIEVGQVILACKEQGVRILAPRRNCLRFVFHRDIDDNGLRRAIQVLEEVTGELSRLGGKRWEGDDPEAKPWND